MSASNPKPYKRLLNGLLVLSRWLLGAHFVWMGLTKAMDPVGFLKLLRQYELTQQPFLLNGIAATLPWFEVICGILLLLGVAVRGTALLCLAMLIPFSGVVLSRALALAAAHHLPFCAVKFDCGCGAGEVFICRKLLDNSIQIIGAALLLAGLGRPLSCCYGLFGNRPVRQ
jgi:uncharacterized membrane protein YphA (DoxX/SURF4 family)